MQLQHQEACVVLHQAQGQAVSGAGVLHAGLLLLLLLCQAQCALASREDAAADAAGAGRVAAAGGDAAPAAPAGTGDCSAYTGAFAGCRVMLVLILSLALLGECYCCCMLAPGQRGVWSRRT